MYITKQTKKDTGRPPKRKKYKNPTTQKNSLPLTQTTEPTTEQMAFFLKVLLLSKAKSDSLTQ